MAIVELQLSQINLEIIIYDFKLLLRNVQSSV